MKPLNYGIILFLLLNCQTGFAQFTINGPNCVTSGAANYYMINGSGWNGSTPMKWCVSSGGSLSTNGTTWTTSCVSGSPSLPGIYAKFTLNGWIQLTVNNTTQITLNITLNSALNGGSISNQTQTITYNTTPATLNCSVATGGYCTPSYSYQWMQSSDGVNFTNISGAGQNLSFSSPLTQTTYYKRQVTETTTNTTAYSNIATVTVNPPPIIPGASTPTFQITNTYTETPICLIASPSTIITCNSDTCFSYQWQQSTDQVTWTNISGAVDFGYNPGSGQPTVTTYYRFQSKYGSQTAYSNVDTIQSENVVIGGPTECWLGQTVTYYYYYGSPISSYDWNPSTGATIIGQYLGVATVTVQWTTQLSGLQPINLTYTGHNYTLYVHVKTYPLFPGDIKIPKLYKETDSSVTLQPSPTFGGSCLANYSYQWQQSTDSVNYTNITGQTSSALNITPIQSIYYRRQVTCGSAAYSDTCHVILYPYFNPGTISTTVSDSIGWNTVPPSVTGGPASGGLDTTYSYQWYYSTDGITYYSAGEYGQNLNFQPAALLTTTYYYRAATCNGTTRSSNIIKIPVKIVVYNPGLISPYTTVVSSGSSPALTGTAATGGTSVTYAYQWQQSNDEVTWTNCSGGTTQNYTPSALTLTTYFRRYVTNGNQSAYSTASGYYNEIKVKVVGTLGLITPNGATQATSSGITPVTINPYSYPGLTAAMVNSVSTWQVEKPGVATAAAAEALTSTTDYREATAYFDDLGREIQTVAKQVTPDNSDLISTTNYDLLGRVVQKFLPYTDTLASGTFRTNAPTKQTGFYNSFFSNTEGFYYSNTIYDGSPLNRVVKQTEPGNSWTGTNIGPRTDYTFNTALDSVQIWMIGNNLTDTPHVTGTYPAGTLALLVTTDENQNKVMEYKDIDGKTILKKVQLNDTLYNGYYGWLCTYYVYDVFNRLRTVLSPKAVQYASSNNWNTNSTVRNELCFQYNYDSAGKMITKRIPGAGEQDMVYDARNRLIMRQDSLLRLGGQWDVTVFDSLDRPIKTAVWSNSNNRAYHQGQAQFSITYPTLSGTYTVLTESFFDDYSWESRSDININQQFTTNFNDNNDLPVIWTAAYSWTDSLTSQTRGLATGTRTNVLNSTQYLYSVPFYDNFTRVVQIQSENVSTAWDTLTTKYDFSGHLLSTCEAHAIVSSVGPIKWNKVVTAFNYDAAARLKGTNKYLNGSTTAETINTNTYDELGRLGTKSLGSKPVETLTFSYNIRGWLKGINRNYANNGGSNWFGEDISYDYGFNNNQVNSNIAGVVWMSKGDPVSRAYGYNYDNTNRLLKADFTQNNGSGFVKDAQVDFNVDSLKYDGNGNILLMQQKGLQINSSTVIDHLVYSYLQTGGWSNKLASVADNSGNTAPLGDFKDGTNTGNDYAYDGNGNLLVDSNKSISTITYNILNLPQIVPMKGKGSISYVYDAAGNKLKKIVVDSTLTPATTTTTTYESPFVYKNDSLQFIDQDEGRVRNVLINPSQGWTTANIQYVYDYFLKDHLGNTRMVVTEETEHDSYAATMEQQNAQIENLLFDSVSSTQIAKPAGFDTDTSNHYVSGLNASSSVNKRVGPTIILKVMAGDTITASTYAWYSGAVQPPSGPSLLNSLVPMLASSSIGVSSGHLLTTEQSSLNTILDNNFPAFLTYKDGQYNSSSPKAFLNWALFDDRFNYVQGGVTQVPVINAGQYKQVLTASLPTTIPKNGYLYIYVSNESPQYVYFDNVTIQDSRGELLEENHYYPFGLTMAGISDRSVKSNYAENKFRFGGKELQNKEFSDGSGLEEFDFAARHYDPQIGRWHNLDSKADKLPQHSPFEYSINNPILFVDPDGKFPYPIHIRSFAPFPTFGGGFGGDGANRGYSTTLGKAEIGSQGVTSRVQQTFTVDPSAKTSSSLKTWSDPSSHPILGSATAKPTGNENASFSSSEKGNTADVTANMAGANPLVPGSPDIDVKMKLTLTENIDKGILSVEASMKGDRFPAAEAFIGDTKGQQVFIGVSGYDGNPYTSLPGNNDRPMMYANFDVKINNKGEFVSVVAGGKTYTVEEWNKTVMACSLEYQKPPKAAGFGGGNGGGSGAGTASGAW
jgi:RHS repeat-associated protein